MSNIYLLSLKYVNGSIPSDPTIVSIDTARMVQNISHASLEVRVAYFSTCVRNDEHGWHCSSDVTSLAGSYTALQDPLNMICPLFSGSDLAAYFKRGCSCHNRKCRIWQNQVKFGVKRGRAQLGRSRLSGDPSHRNFDLGTEHQIP
ncbi:hypothetical protein FH972_021410 [Carpinus fangiana]|uniref:Uncharacterized protein n=1 Tax=Carpinus fangiana TaxID=176857 RepID=A0A5N6KPM4_9ROSI|nr:hypothetical protein FH972_021410 [Carpinus fangiana]